MIYRYVRAVRSPRWSSLFSYTCCIRNIVKWGFSGVEWGFYIARLSPISIRCQWTRIRSHHNWISLMNKRTFVCLYSHSARLEQIKTTQYQWYALIYKTIWYFTGHLKLIRFTNAENLNSDYRQSFSRRVYLFIYSSSWMWHRPDI